MSLGHSPSSWLWLGLGGPPAALLFIIFLFMAPESGWLARLRLEGPLLAWLLGCVAWGVGMRQSYRTGIRSLVAWAALGGLGALVLASLVGVVFGACTRQDLNLFGGHGGTHDIGVIGAAEMWGLLFGVGLGALGLVPGVVVGVLVGKRQRSAQPTQTVPAPVPLSHTASASAAAPSHSLSGTSELAIAVIIVTAVIMGAVGFLMGLAMDYGRQLGFFLAVNGAAVSAALCFARGTARRLGAALVAGLVAGAMLRPFQEWHALGPRDLFLVDSLQEMMRGALFGLVATPNSAAVAYLVHAGVERITRPKPS
jgi:hypothetical protein